MGWPAVLLSFLLLVPAPVPAQEDDALPGIPFKEGDRLSFEDLALLEGYVPEPFWEHREYFFFEGMDLKIGPIDYDYSPTEDWKALTAIPNVTAASSLSASIFNNARSVSLSRPTTCAVYFD